MPRHLLLLGIFSFLVTSSTFADSSAWFPYLPRISGTPWVSNNQDVLQGDAMAALFGNDQNIIWGDLIGKNALDSSWSGGLGAGYRYVYNDERILGFYLFADDSHALDGGHHFWDVSPGLESLGRLWDFRVNGYFPVSNKNPLVQEGFADTFNQVQFIVFSGHNQYDRLLDLYQAVGNGVDGEIGRFIVPGLTAYVGGYYFGAGNSSDSTLVNPQTVRGVSARAQYEFNSHTALELSNTYDNVLHDTILGGIRFTLGGTGASDQDRTDISGRLLDPISRELATQGQGTAIPVQNQLQLGSGLILERGNIWFFTPGGSTVARAGTPVITASSCTFEHPCSNTIFDQNTIDQISNIAPAANFYLNTGDYDLLANNMSEGGTDGIIQFTNSQSIYGRMNNFYEAGQGSSRPSLEGSLDFPTSGTISTIDSIQLFNDSIPETQGISLESNASVTLSNSLLGSLTNAAQAYADGIVLNGSGNTLTVLNSIVNAFDPVEAAGIVVSSNNSSINILQSVINASVTGTTANNVARSITDISSGNNHYILNNNIINASAINGTSTNEATGILDFASGSNQFTFGAHNIISALASGPDTNQAVGIFEISIVGAQYTFGSDEIISASVNNGIGNNHSYGILVQAPNDSFIFGNNNTINSFANSTGNNLAYGVRDESVGGNTYIFASGDQVNASAFGGTIINVVGLSDAGSVSTWINVAAVTYSGNGTKCSGISPCP